MRRGQARRTKYKQANGKHRETRQSIEGASKAADEADARLMPARRRAPPSRQRATAGPREPAAAAPPPPPRAPKARASLKDAFGRGGALAMGLDESGSGCEGGGDGWTRARTRRPGASTRHCRGRQCQRRRCDDDGRARTNLRAGRRDAAMEKGGNVKAAIGKRVRANKKWGTRW